MCQLNSPIAFLPFFFFFLFSFLLVERSQGRKPETVDLGLGGAVNALCHFGQIASAFRVVDFFAGKRGGWTQWEVPRGLKH